MLVRIRDPEVPASLSILSAVAEDLQDTLEESDLVYWTGRVKLGPDGTEWDTISFQV